MKVRFMYSVNSKTNEELMSDPIELLIELHNMYENGNLAAEFDKHKNKMINSDELISIMSEVEKLIPLKMEPRQAAESMHVLEEQARYEAIKASEDKVIDMRKQFQKKMSENGGALGLTRKLVKALEENDLATIGLVTMDMSELVHQDD